MVRNHFRTTDRPWQRKIIKLATRLVLGRRRAHWQDFFPGLVIRTAVGGKRTVFYGDEELVSLASTDELKRRAGSFIAIIGSGPSVASANLAALPAGSAILLNGAISLIDAHRLAPLAIAIEDERFIHRHFPTLEGLSSVHLLLLSVSVLRAVAARDSHWLKGRAVILIDDVRKPYHLPVRGAAECEELAFAQIDASTGAGFSTDPDRGVFQGGSVVVSALQFAMACAPAEIGFLGVDISNASSPRFYESAGEAASSGIAGAEHRILSHIDLARRVALRSGIRLVSFSAVSALLNCGIDYDSRLQHPDAAERK